MLAESQQQLTTRLFKIAPSLKQRQIFYLTRLASFRNFITMNG